MTLFATAVLLFLSAAASAPEFTAKVVRVIDGDSLRVLHGSRAIDVRLEGIDCPEHGQASGEGAKQTTAALVLDRTVTIQPKGKDEYGRTVATVVLPDGKILNRELVRLGYAWWFRKYSKDEQLGRLEAEARWAKRGLWADPHPVPPWEWRETQRKADVPSSSVQVVPNGVEIAGLLPNPKGKDEGNEQVAIRNTTDKAVKLAGWKLRDRTGNQFAVSGTVPAHGRLTITMTEPTMPLNNDGDEVLLIDADGVVRSRVVYTEEQVKSGTWINFGD